jgi:lipopolysaccharide export system protein LptA
MMIGTIKTHALTVLLGFALAGPAMAQEGGFLGRMGEPIDTSAPIEIAADALEVLQTEQVAIFSGNVDAIQGDMRLRASELRVHYASGSGTGGEISRIDADGDVQVSSANETARGDRAVYDVLQEQVTMEGNVVLTQGANVLEGNRLTIDLASGRSRIEGASGTFSPEEPAETEGGGRVRGVFTIPRNDGADQSPPADETDNEPDSATEGDGAE